MPFAEKMRLWMPLHENGTNRALHFIGGYLFVFAVLVPLSWFHFELGGVSLCVARIAVLALAGYCLSLELTAGVLAVALLIPTLFAAEAVAALPRGTSAAIAAGVMVFRFSIVLSGHRFFEKKMHGLSLGGPVLFVVEPVYLFTHLMFSLGMKQQMLATIKNPAQPNSQK